MNRRYQQAAAISAIGLGTIVWSLVSPDSGGDLALVIGSGAIPLSVLLFVSGRLGRQLPWNAVVGGGVIGAAIAIASLAVVFGFAYAFFLGFADEAVALADALQLDPGVTSLIGSPWTIVLLIELVVVAPVTEEFGKAVGSRLAHVTDRQSAFLAGVAAGTGFAVLENILYASGGSFLGEAWQSIVIARMLGAAVHPLASGLVVMGWWEWRQRHDAGLAVRRVLVGAGAHALWNGSLVVVGVVSTAFDVGGTPQAYALTSLAYAAALGVIFAGALWRMTVSVAADNDTLLVLDPGDGRVLGAWSLLAASLLIPVAMLLIAFPGLGI